MEQSGQEKEEEEETGSEKGADEEQKQEAVKDGEEAEGENPLERYMKMVLEARQKQNTQVSCMHICPRLLLNFA